MTVTIRDLTFPDIDAAAAAFNVQRRAILRAIRLGRLDQVGLRPHETRHRHGPEPFKVRIRGAVYDSVQAAAEAHSVSPITVRTAIRYGREDFIGLGKSRKHNRNSVGRAPGNAQSITVGRITFASKAELARFCGLGRTTVRNHLAKGNVGILIAHVMRAQAKLEGHRKRMPGQTYVPLREVDEAA